MQRTCDLAIAAMQRSATYRMLWVCKQTTMPERSRRNTTTAVIVN